MSSTRNPASQARRMAIKKAQVGIPALVTTIAAILPLMLWLGWAIGSKRNWSTPLSPDSASSWVSALATLAIATLTFILAKETWYLRLAQASQLAELKRENIRPNVNVQLDPSKVGLNFVDVKVSNLGRGIARKVRIEFIDEVGNVVRDGTDPVVEKFRKLAIFRQGIESMGIGQEISSFVFSFHDLGSELNGDIFRPTLRFSVTFEDVEGAKYQNEFVVDFAQYEGISELGGGDPLHLISKELKQIRECLAKASRPDSRIGINVFSSEDRAKEREQVEEILKSRGGEKGPDS